MRKPYAIALLSTIVLFYAGCQKQIDLISQANQGSRADSLSPCGHSFDTTLINYDGLLSGSIKVLNDQAGYNVVIREVFTDYKITRVQLLYGTRQHVIDNI